MPAGGFVRPSITPDNHVLGDASAPFPRIAPGRAWAPVAGERQDLKFETWNCTAFGATDQIEMYMRQVFGADVNYSDRWVGIISGTKEGGNDPQVVYEAIRKNGLVLESSLPWSGDLSGVEEYYSFKGADEAELRAEGLRWLAEFDFAHKWAFREGDPWERRMAAMEDGLEMSPLAIAVYAWEEDASGRYVADGQENHWSSAYAMDGEVIKDLDSYDPFLKDVLQRPSFCKVIRISRKAAPAAGSAIPGNGGAISTVRAFIKMLISIICGKRS